VSKARKEKGSRFWFQIQAEWSDEGFERREQPRQLAASAPAQMSGNILLVEDNLTNRKVATAMLKKLGLTVMTAEDGQQAVDLVADGATPDLILMDLHMPVMDGHTATRQIRLWEAGQGKPRFPIIALTADAYEDDRQHCLEAGMDDFLAKPVVLAALKSVLEQWLPVLPAPEPSGDAGAVTPRPLPERHSIVVLIEELLPLLEQSRYDALPKLKALQALLAGTELTVALAELARDLNLLQFDSVHRRLSRLAADQHWIAPPA
jgi:CheY-like chemotaxis protein